MRSTQGTPVPAGMALLIRPNLAAVALVIAAWLGLTRKGAGRFAAALVPFVAAVGVVNASIYESAWTSGYGTLDDLYALSFAAPNVPQFNIRLYTGDNDWRERMSWSLGASSAPFRSSTLCTRR